MRTMRFGSSAVAVCLLASTASAGFGSTETYLPSVGRIPGKFGAQFYSTVWATNLTSAPQTFTFRFLKAGQSNPSPPSFEDTLQPGETRVYENVVESKLGLTNVLGAARITSSGEIFFAERIYNQQPGDDLGKTEGLFFAGVPKSFSISAGQSATIQGIDQGGAENFRYNFALIETGGGSADVNVQIFDGNGTLLGQRSFPLSPYEQIQPNVADVVPSIATTNARITATVTGGSGSVLMAGAQLANESQDSSGFEMTFRDELLGGGGGTAGVTSLNGLTGALTLKPGSGISITPSGSQISIAYTGGGGGGITSVTHDPSLSGAGTGSSPLAIANGQVVRSLNGLHDDVTLAAGANVTITPNGSSLAIASQGFTLPFAGSTASTQAFRVENTAPSVPASLVIGIEGESVSDGVGSIGILGIAGNVNVFQPSSGVGIMGFGPGGGIIGNSPNGVGVTGSSSSGDGVLGKSTSSNGVEGNVTNSSAGVAGVNHSSGPGLYGENQSGGPAGDFVGDVVILGGLSASGVKNFVSPDPADPSKEIVYTSLEGPESGTYFRGTARVVNGFATIDVPEDFRMVTSAKGLTVQLTPIGDLAVLAVMRQDLDRIVVRGSNDVEFHYLVNGVRRGFEDHPTIQTNRTYVPRCAGDDALRHLPAAIVEELEADGILNRDGTVSLETAHRLGWDEQESWKRAEEQEAKR